MALASWPITEGRWDGLEGTAAIPTNIHLDLVKEGRIPDPFPGMNEKLVQWVHDQPWTFRTSFKVNTRPLGGERFVLVLEGLDTFAAVKVDGKSVLQSDNMFLSHRVDVTDFVAADPESVHEVEIVFEPALRVGDRLLQEHGKRVCWNGHYSRVFVRKAQYHYGWDWGPSLVTCGPWKHMALERYRARLASVHAVPSVSRDLTKATVAFSARVEAPEDTTMYFVSVVATSAGGKEFRLSLNPSSEDKTLFANKLELQDPDIWYPRGYGAQNQYKLEYTLTTAGPPSDEYHVEPLRDTVTKKLGLRRVELIQDPLPKEEGNDLSGGSTFYFRINNVDTFCGGSNWIPGDSFLPRVTKASLEKWLGTLLAVRGNQVMVRIWGGGIYESEDFYDICDEQGILVWQDICTACGDYPAHLDYFAKSIAAEVEQNFERLRWHPSLVMIAGSNEDYQVADEEVGYGASSVDKFREEPFPSRWLYEVKYPEIIREVCNASTGDMIGVAGEDASGVIYWPGSPFSGQDATDRTVGDIHQWNIWGGIQAPYQRYPDLGGRFVSEFGMISYPASKTIKSGFMKDDTPETEYHPQSETLAHHVKAHSLEKRMLAYIAETYRITSGTMDEMIYLSQLVQSEAMYIAYRGWRQKWGKRESGGVLVWQINDCWPVTSWAIIDYYFRPKMAFYSIARALKPVTLIGRRFTTDPKPNNKVEEMVRSKSTKTLSKGKLHSIPHTYPPIKSRVEIVISSIAPTDMKGLSLSIDYMSIITGDKKTVKAVDSLEVGSNETVMLFAEEVPVDPPTVVVATLQDSDGKVLHQELEWPEPLKWVAMPDPGFKTHVKEEGGSAFVEVEVERPTKALWFQEEDGESWSDNGIDIVPGHKVVLKVSGFVERKPKAVFYGLHGQ